MTIDDSRPNGVAKLATLATFAHTDGAVCRPLIYSPSKPTPCYIYGVTTRNATGTTSHPAPGTCMCKRYYTHLRLPFVNTAIDQNLSHPPNLCDSRPSAYTSANKRVRKGLRTSNSYLLFSIVLRSRVDYSLCTAYQIPSDRRSPA